MSRTELAKELALEAVLDVLQWVVAGTVIAMVIPVSRETNNLIVIGTIMLAALVIATPLVMLIKWLRRVRRHG